MDMENNKYGEEITRLDLAKYGLSDLEGKNILTLERSDMDRVLVALGNDDISLNIPIPCTPENVQKVLSYSECRRCGSCCIPNPLNPGSPGIEAFEDELKSIASYLKLLYDDLKKKTQVGQVTSYPYQVVKLGYTRWLPLPCPFYDAEQNACQVYLVRPIVCKTFPVIFTGDDTYMSIKVSCDYGKDIVIEVCKRLRASDPYLEIMI
jgi:Fe-S-cluster containining protein